MNQVFTGWPEPRRRPVGWDLPLGRRRTRLEMWMRNDPLYQVIGSVPTLDQNYADDRSLIDRISGRQLITFTRASTATYVGPDGQLRTAAVNEPRFQHDPVTGRCLGLLLEAHNSAKTNFLLNSGTLATQDVTVTAQAYTLSFTGTGTVTLSGASTAGPLVGTGDGEANRVILRFTPTAGTLTLTVTGSVINAQLENGDYVTSYIPTAGTTVSRQNDQFTITGANFSSWYNNSEGMVMVDVAGGIPNSNQGPFFGLDGDGGYRNNFTEWRIECNGNVNGLLFTTQIFSSSAVQQASIIGTGIMPEYTNANGRRIPYGMRGFFRAGATGVSIAYGTRATNLKGISGTVTLSPAGLPNVNRVVIDAGGGSSNSGQSIIIARHAYWPYVLPSGPLSTWGAFNYP